MRRFVYGCCLLLPRHAVHVCCLGVAAVRQVNLNLMLCMAISGVALPLGSRCFGVSIEDIVHVSRLIVNLIFIV